MTFSLPDLPYAYDALRPTCRRKRSNIHHDKHHLAYVNNGNNLLKGTEWEGKSLEDIVKGSYGKNAGLFNNAGQHYNHLHFWKWMKPNGGGKIPGELEKALIDSFGSVEKAKEELVQAGTTQFGSGWGWLAVVDGKIAPPRPRTAKARSSTTASRSSASTSGNIPITSTTATVAPTISRRSSITWSTGNTSPNSITPRSADRRRRATGSSLDEPAGLRQAAPPPSVTRSD